MATRKLQDSVVLLSPPTLADVPAITAACQDPEIARWTPIPFPYSSEHAQSFVEEFVPALEQRSGAVWAIRVPQSEHFELAGMISLGAPDSGHEIGYWMAAQHRRRGLLARAMKLVLDEAFTQLNAPRVNWVAAVGNWPSWRCAWAQGFVREGVSRSLLRNLDDPHSPLDAWTASLLATDPRGKPATAWDGPELLKNGSASPAIPDPRDPEALVRQFHEVYALPISTRAAAVDIDRIHMRMGLISEEFAELVGAVYGPQAERIVLQAVAHAVAGDEGHRDTVGAADALADMIYVIYGMALETGIPLDGVLRAVQRSNMSKLGADGHPIYRADGKVLKGPGFFEPQIREVLENTRLAP